MAIRLTRYSLKVTNAQLVNICSYLLVNYLVSKTTAISDMSSLFISLFGVTITLRMLQNCDMIVVKVVPVPELYLTAVLLNHQKTGAQHLHIARDDAENVFGYVFVVSS